MRTLLFSLIAIIAFIPVAVFAQQNLVNLPIGETGNFNDYINAVYLMFISIAALIAVIKIIIAGVKYMFTDIVTQKSDAKNDIKGALLGLLVVLAAVLVLGIINPDLTTFSPEITGIERRERPVVNSGPTYSELCANYACTTTADGVGSTDFFAGANNENNGDIQGIIDGCEGSVFVSETGTECFTLGDAERERISSIFLASGGDENQVENNIDLYRRYVAPYLIESEDPNTIFTVSGDYTVYNARLVCTSLGGEVSSWFNILPGAELTCDPA